MINIQFLRQRTEFDADVIDQRRKLGRLGFDGDEAVFHLRHVQQRIDAAEQLANRAPSGIGGRFR